MREEHLAATRTAGGAITISERGVIRTLLGVLLVLNAANLVGIALGADDRGSRYLLLALEQNPSTWFSAAQLALATVLALAVAEGRPDAVNWRTVAGVLAFLSLDEVATIHERLGGLPVVPGIGSRAWAGAGLLLVAAVTWRLLPWVVRIGGPLRFALLAGGALFVAGAVGFEVLAGDWRVAHGEDGIYWALTTAEENLELLGVFVVVRLLLAHLQATGRPLTVQVER